jgi:hypothetical protein
MTVPSSSRSDCRRTVRIGTVRTVNSRWLAAIPRVAAALALTPAGVLLGTGPAAAHPPAPQAPDAAYYRTELSGVNPAVAGVAASVDPGGEWVELRVTGPGVVLVRGYTGESYLRVTANSVEENQLSQTTYLNRALFADSVPTGTDTGSLAPSWKLIGTNGSVRWHDHRIHWMGQSRPPAVAADPTRSHVVGSWTVHAVADTTPFDITGTVRWVGAPRGAFALRAAWLMALAPAVLMAGLVAWHLTRQRRAAAAELTFSPVIPNPRG